MDELSGLSSGKFQYNESNIYRSNFQLKTCFMLSLLLRTEKTQFTYEDDLYARITQCFLPVWLYSKSLFSHRLKILCYTCRA